MVAYLPHGFKVRRLYTISNGTNQEKTKQNGTTYIYTFMRAQKHCVVDVNSLSDVRPANDGHVDDIFLLDTGVHFVQVLRNLVHHIVHLHTHTHVPQKDENHQHRWRVPLRGRPATKKAVVSS